MHLLFAWGTRHAIESLIAALLDMHDRQPNFYAGAKGQDNGESLEG